jgi:PIN domain nuclease of toxin-antitoxin system
MNILIDTHIFLWIAGNKLSKIKTNDLDILSKNDIYFSSISIAEISIKKSIGKLQLDGDILTVLSDMDITVLDFKTQDAILLESLPNYHKDPFDRMIIAQAITNNFKLISYDKAFQNYVKNGLNL